MAGNIYGLIRVSTKEQNEDRQVIRMQEIGISIDNIVIEKESGKSTDRKKYKRLVKRLKSGDTLYIENVDRLSRDYDGILNEWHILTKQKGVTIKILDTPMLNDDNPKNDVLIKFVQDFLLRTLALGADLEWQKIKSRQAGGIAAARADGRNLGRPKAVRTEIELKIAKQYLNHEISFDNALDILDIKKTAFYNLCRLVDDMQNSSLE